MKNNETNYLFPCCIFHDKIVSYGPKGPDSSGEYIT